MSTPPKETFTDAPTDAPKSTPTSTPKDTPEGSSGEAKATAPVTPATPTAPAALRTRIRALAPSLPRSVQRVAEAVAADPAGCSALTVTALAEHTATSEATVVRTARVLGYPGYKELRLALAGLAAQQEAGTAPAVTADIAVDDSLAEVVAKLAADERQTLADTAAGLDLSALGGAVTALATARRIDVYGVGASALVGQDLAQKLLRIGLIAHAHTDPHLALTSAVQLRPGDAAVAITHSGTTVDVLDPLRTAFERGATTLAITGRPDAPVAHHADLLLATSGARESELRPAAMSSRTGQLLVVDCLFVGVAQRTYETAAPALAATHEALAPRHPPRHTVR